MSTELKAPVVNVIPVDAVTGTNRFGPGRCFRCGKPVIKPAITLEDGSGEGSTCADHEGRLRAHANVATVAPEGWLGMSKVCRKLEALGFKTSEIVRACGGDATTEPVLHEVFRPVYVGNRKFLDPQVLIIGVDLLKGARTAPAKVPDKAPAKPDAKPATAIASVLKTAVKADKKA
jgi:hypothetical protein